MTQQIQIIPQYINQPKDPSWANGSVKDTGGQLWSVHKDALGMFVKGQPANITYDPPYGNKKYPQIVSVNGQQIGQQQSAGFTPLGQAAHGAVPAQPAGGYVPAPPQPASPMPLASHSPAPQASPGGASKECGMFVMGVIGRCLQGTGTFPDAKTLRDMVYNAKLAWEIEMEGRAEPQAQPAQQPQPGNAGPPAGHPAAGDLDDRIPFAPLRDLP